MALLLDLSDHIVLVTGGRGGVGSGVADRFRAAGATVATCGRTEAPSGSTGADDHLVCDVRDPEAVSAMIDAIVTRHGRLDAVVNNAGGAPSAPAADASPGFHRKVVELNLLSPLLVAQAANRVMQQQPDGGSVVNISSVSGLRPSPGTAAYGAAKAGVDSLTRSLAVEWAPKVRVNAIDVGMVRTEHAGDHYGGNAGVARVEATIPLGRMATPVDVGNVAVFLASDLASYVSGATIECHGGGEPPVFLTARKDDQ